MFVLFYHHIYMVVSGLHPFTAGIQNEALTGYFSVLLQNIPLKWCPRHSSLERQETKCDQQ